MSAVPMKRGITETCTHSLSTASAVTLARYRLLGAELPPIEETLSLGELARQYLQGIYGRLNHGAASPILSGKMEDGSVVKGHRHAFYLPADEDADGRIDHLTIYARGILAADGRDEGFDQRELQALDQFNRLRQLGHRPDLQLVLIALGQCSVSASTPILGPSRHWRSATPFVPPRHQKFRGRKRENPPDQLCGEIMKRGLPQPLILRPLPRCPLANRSLSWTGFRLQRLQGQGDRGQGFACGFELEFPEPLVGPLAFGYASHFGLGLFVADDGLRCRETLQQAKPRG